MNLPQPNCQGTDFFPPPFQPTHTLDGVVGWFSEEEGEFLRKKVKNIYKGNILQIGTFHGLSICYIKDICRENKTKIWSLDKFFYQEFYDNIKRWKVKNIINVIIADSRRAYLKLSNNFFDFIFIDGNHTKKFVENDIVNYWPKLKMSGFMAGHDYVDNHPDVIKVVKEIFDIQKPVTQTTIWVTPKKIHATYYGNNN